MNIVNAKYCLSDYILGCLKPLSRKCVLRSVCQSTDPDQDAVRRLEVPAAVVAVTAAAVVLVVWIDVVDV